MSTAHVDNDTPKATADDVKTMFKDTPGRQSHRGNPRSGPAPAPAAGRSAEHQNAVAGRMEARLRTARRVLAHPRDLIEENAAKLTPDPEVRKVTTTAIRCLLAPYTADDAHTGKSTRRFLLSAAAITAVLAAVAVLRNR